MSGPQVEAIQLHELACWRVRVAGSELLITQQGAQILSYRQSQSQPPVIWLSPQAAYERGQGVRGGVPVCWPWFGALQGNPQAVQAMVTPGQEAPFHGLVRTLDWQLGEIEEQADSVLLQFSFNSQTQPLAIWPHAAELTLRVRLSAEHLSIELITRNLGTTTLAISQALHTYFAVSDIRQVSIEGLEGCEYVDTLADWQIFEQQGAVDFTGETDRIYQNTPAQLHIVDAAWNRKISLVSRASASAIVWNPWIEKAKRLSQFAYNDWQGMLCIEHANVLKDVQKLVPGAEHCLALEISSGVISG
ncbi:D-hexose-6-phosphate mutarotase [Pseudomonas sp. 5P_3.1_Bac2]|uniref:D-hexose-6-phosphate mutarotase n=1 Tax=Pseudomonas sp. 5P_3.1_Bac2 TaxID=2971617 RepID=UPI0021C7EBCE|nr:D-hexose-6-phosphate mutarotase [Pseudomonas sp. 5P_3.1_Bac2]MCU1718957.1 D-hexose-6-phosphate mutarotase [Pseudomonas sp. 5P_3.1_Bac2]